MSVRILCALARIVVFAVPVVWPGQVAAIELPPQPLPPVFARSGPDIDLPEPFGDAAIERVQGRLLEKWNAARAGLRIDVDIVAACRADIDGCESVAAKHMIGIIEAAQRREGRAQIGEINRAVNLAVAAASDKVQYGIEDKWASPLMTFTSGRGDCEDYALAKYAALRAAGFSDGDLRMLIVRLPLSQTDHAVLSVRHQGRWLILDNRRFAMLDAVHLDAVPLFALRGDEEPQASMAALNAEQYPM